MVLITKSKMSVTVNCFEGLQIEKCSCPTFFCCRRNNAVSAPAAITNGVVYFGANDIYNQNEVEPYHVCVVQSPNRVLSSVGPDENDNLEEWDTMLVDVKHRIVTFDGKRWPHLMLHGPSKGKLLSAALRPVIRTVCEPLVTLALTGAARQMHTICNSESMTMFANPVMQDKAIIGVQLTYRPTTITETDVLRIIAQHTEDV
jgi:hypothetical protein